MLGLSDMPQLLEMTTLAYSVKELKFCLLTCQVFFTSLATSIGIIANLSSYHYLQQGPMPKMSLIFSLIRTFLILAIMSSCSSSSHFSTCPLAFEVDIVSFRGTTSPSELFMCVMSKVSVNSSDAIPSKHFFR